LTDDIPVSLGFASSGHVWKPRFIWSSQLAATIQGNAARWNWQPSQSAKGVCRQGSASQFTLAQIHKVK
jgi:hypothetical protein